MGFGSAAGLWLFLPTRPKARVEGCRDETADLKPSRTDQRRTPHCRATWNWKARQDEGRYQAELCTVDSLPRWQHGEIDPKSASNGRVHVSLVRFLGLGLAVCRNEGEDPRRIELLERVDELPDDIRVLRESDEAFASGSLGSHDAPSVWSGAARKGGHLDEEPALASQCPKRADLGGNRASHQHAHLELLRKARAREGGAAHVSNLSINDTEFGV